MANVLSLKFSVYFHSSPAPAYPLRYSSADWLSADADVSALVAYADAGVFAKCLVVLSLYPSISEALTAPRPASRDGGRGGPVRDYQHNDHYHRRPPRHCLLVSL